MKPMGCDIRHSPSVRWRSGLTLGLLTIVSVIAAQPVAAQSSCSGLVEAFNAAANAAGLESAVSAGRQVLVAPSCDVQTRVQVGRRLALLHAREANRMESNPGSAAARLALLETGARYAQPWQVMAMIGDIRGVTPGPGGQVDYRGASVAYQAAIADIQDSKLVPNPPPKAEIERIMRLAEQTRMLAPDFVSGEVLMTRDVRGVAVTAVPVPIQFVRGRDEMTPRGVQYAEETWKLLSSQGRPIIALVGHTDPDGSDQYNLELSLRRALAVKRFLTERGYDAQKIDAQGKGRREPLQVAEQTRYTQEQIYEMLRRVEVVFK